MPYVPPKLGPFELLYRLGAGGMAETFVAVRRGPAGFAQRVCLKRILPAYADDAEFVRSFLEEARTSAGLRHANIVQVLDFDQVEGGQGHYLALELIDGLDLRALLSRGATFDAELVAWIASEIGAALEHAHAADGARAGVVHRDISPSNVLISRAGEVKLTDFGIARVVGGPHRTASGIIKGKVPYMPPEYIEVGRFDARGDLFSLGVLLFELLHRERPFDGDTELDTLRRIVSGDRRPFTADAPAELAQCVERLLSTGPDARFDDARALLDALPPLAVNRARRRLAEMVRAYPPPSGQRSVPSADDVSPIAATLPLSSSEARGDPAATRTAPSQRRSLRLSLPARRALVGACAMLFVVGLVALFRHDPQANATAQPTEHAAAFPARPAPTSTPAERTPPVPATATAIPPTSAAMLGPATSAAPATPRAPSEAAPPADAAAAVAARAAEPKPTELRVIVVPFGDVWIDGKSMGQSPLTVRVSPGSHTVAVGDGRAREHRTVHVTAGEHARVLFQREAAPR